MLTRNHADFLTLEQRMIRGMPRNFAQSDLAPINPGTGEIQRLLIARSLVEP
jgi:alkylation response protein AidB-like acyl-CoA dehydrogenase